MVKARAVDILMDGNDAEGRIRIGSDSLADRLLMLGNIVVVGVEHDEQAGAVGVVVVAARLGLTVAGLVRVIEVVHVVRVERVVVADRGRNRQGRQCVRREVARVLLFLGLAGLVDLVACGDHKIKAGVLLHRNVERAVPCKAVVARRGVGSAAVRNQLPAVLRLALGCADLRVADVQDLRGFEIARGVGLHLGLGAALFHRVVVGVIRLEAGHGDVVVRVRLAVRQAGIHRRGRALKRSEIVAVRAEVHDRGGCAVRILAVPREVQLGLIRAGGERYLRVVSCQRSPALGPSLPGCGTAGQAGVVVVRRKRSRARAEQQRAGQNAREYSFCLHVCITPSVSYCRAYFTFPCFQKRV